MTSTVELTVAGKPEIISISRVFNAGYTGRDQAAVQQHIDELAEQGIAPPGEVPTLFSVPSYMVIQGGNVEATHPKTSGEAEWALLYRGEERSPLITVASDHTDRRLEAHDVEASKQISPNVIGAEAWEIESLGADVDELVLRSYVDEDGEWVMLQEGDLSELLSPSNWIERLRELGRLEPGSLLLGGTLPMQDPALQFSPGWRVSLMHPNGSSLEVSYRVKQLLPSLL